MKIYVAAKVKAKKEVVEQIDSNHFKVSVKEVPISGRANAAIEKALADYFGIAHSRIRVSAGHTSKRKIIEIN